MATKYKYYDVLISGAGPSGIIAALYAQKHGLKSLIIERGSFPKDKICGDAFMPCCFEILNDLGFDSNAFIQNFVEINQAEIIVNRLVTKIPTLIFNSKRKKSDELFYALAKNRIEIIKESEISKIEYLDEKYFASIKSRDDKFNVEYRYIIGADGASSQVRRLYNMPKPTHYAIATRTYLKFDSSQKKTFFLKYIKETIPGYFWGFSVDEETVNTGVILFDIEKQTRINEIHEKLVSDFFGVKKIETDVWQLPFCYDIEDTIKGNCFLIGDAGGFIDPLLGHGIDTAMYSAKICIESIFEDIEAPQQLYMNKMTQCINKQRIENRIFRDSLVDVFNKGDEYFMDYYLKHLGKGMLEYHLFK